MFESSKLPPTPLKAAVVGVRKGVALETCTSLDLLVVRPIVDLCFPTRERRKCMLHSGIPNLDHTAIRLLSPHGINSMTLSVLIEPWLKPTRPNKRE